MVSEVVRILPKYIFASCLGVGLQMAGITVRDWRFYAISVPAILLVSCLHGLEAARMLKVKKNIYDILDKETCLYGTTLEEIITAIWEASDQAIRCDSAIAIAKRAILTGVATTPKEFERIVGIATKWAHCNGLEVEQCVDVFVTAAARQSRKLAVDKLGLVISDKTLAELPALAESPSTERTQAFLEAMICATGWDRVRIGITVGIEA